MLIDLSAYPQITRVCKLMEMSVLNGPGDSDASDTERHWIGTCEELAAGLRSSQVTPGFGEVKALDEFCALHKDKFEAWAEQETQPPFGWWTKAGSAKKVVSITGVPYLGPQEPSGDLTKHEQPMPFSRGPYIKAGYSILAQDGSLVATAAVCAEASANANLLAGAWEALTMLHEYASTDACTDHPESETCRFCVSMNVIRRSMGEPDGQVPLLTWYARFKEQQQIAKSYKDLHEKRENEVNQVCHDIQERIFTLRAKLDRFRISSPTEAKALANSIAEISIIKAALEK